MWYTPQNKHGTWKWTLGKGDSYWKPSFPGSMLIFGGVVSWRILLPQRTKVWIHRGLLARLTVKSHICHLGAGSAQEERCQSEVFKGKTLLTYFHPMPVPKTKLAMDVQTFEIFHRTGGLICKTLLRCLDQKRFAAIYIYIWHNHRTNFQGTFCRQVIQVLIQRRSFHRRLPEYSECQLGLCLKFPLPNKLPVRVEESPRVRKATIPTHFMKCGAKVSYHIMYYHIISYHTIPYHIIHHIIP